MDWSPGSWRSRPVKQDVVYQDRNQLDSAIAKLSRLPPLVTHGEVDSLREQLAKVASGEAFLLQGGDCAESFDNCTHDSIEVKLKIILQMSLVFVWGAHMPVVRIGRMAGQYAKPRSKPFEDHMGTQIHAFRGDNVNGMNVSRRTPDPNRLVDAYFHSCATLNYTRALLTSGFADLHSPQEWNLDFVRSSKARSEYQEIVTSLMDSLTFMKTIGADKDSTLRSADIFTSHEGLMLEFEEAMTREIKSDNRRLWYNLGAHFIWVGDRTRQLDGGHIEYFRGLENPIGVKVGPSMAPDELVRALDILNADKAPGKVTLISRYGASNITKHLPGHIEAVQRSGHPVVWACDPMHGNTKPSEVHPHLKTRHFVDILNELRDSIRIHKENHSRLNGVHFEMTGEKVTECVGGSMGLEDQDLNVAYQTFCDPRLNYEQSLEIALLIAGYLRDERRRSSH